MKKILLLLSCFLSLALLSSCGTSKKAETLKSKGWKPGDTVVIGIDDSFVPMGFRDEHGDLAGFDVELAKTVFENEGIDYQFQPIDWAMKETELKNGTIDVIWNGYSMTPEREKLVAFSQPYLENKQVLVSLDKNKIHSFSDMKGKKLGVQEGSSGESIVRENPQLLLEFVDNQEPVAYKTFTDAFLDLKSGRIDGLVVAQVFADYYLSHDNTDQQFTITEGGFPTEKQAVGVRLSDQTLLETINKGLKRAYENNQSQKISELWFGENRILPPQ